MMTYDFYDWDKDILDWIWIGSDSGVCQIKDHPMFEFMGIDIDKENSYTHKMNDYISDYDKLMDGIKIIETELVIIHGAESYMSIEESYSLKCKYATYMRRGKLEVDTNFKWHKIK